MRRNRKQKGEVDVCENGIILHAMYVLEYVTRHRIHRAAFFVGFAHGHILSAVSTEHTQESIRLVKLFVLSFTAVQSQGRWCTDA